MSTSSENGSTEISAETSSRVCRHMNEDHAVSVYAMARALLAQEPTASGPGHWVLTETSLTGVTTAACHLRAVLCSGDACELRRLAYPFDPPLAGPAELRPRLVAIHHRVCRPRADWLWRKPACRVLVPLSAAVVYGGLVLGRDRLIGAVERVDGLELAVAAAFGSTALFAALVYWSAWVVLAVHPAEGLYVAFHAVRTLKLKWTCALQWFGLISLTGYPITTEFLDLLKVHNKNRAEKKK